MDDVVSNQITIEDIRSQITREDILEAIAALDQGEPTRLDLRLFTTFWRAADDIRPRL
jgi:hypothetical protein